MRRNMKELCLTLLKCETEDEVIETLRNWGLWDDRSLWRAYGDITNNRGVVGNQQSSPVAALVEKLVNSIDAVLIAECYRHGINPSGKATPRSMQEAVDKFLNIPDGKIQNLDPRSRTQFAERIRLVACGTKTQPSYMIIDDGEGQAPDDFPHTFLSLLRENKTGIPFVQGKFNMGSTGVLQFAGTNSFQLILSKRHPDLPVKTTSPRQDEWGFTLLRRLDPSDEQPQTMYVYLAPNSQVPSFASEELPILPGQYPQAYDKEFTAGTCIKIWNFKLTGKQKSIATLDLRYALEKHMIDPALPIRIYERRAGYRANYYDTTMSGLSSVLADDKKHIEPGMDTGGPMEIPGVGSTNIRLVVLKEEEEASGSKRYAGGVFFTVNGQLHSELGADFIARRTKYDYIAQDIIIIVDCTILPQRVREDLFLASRDRMRQGEERTALEDAIIDYLKDHQGLRELNARRRQERLSVKSEEDTITVIQALVRNDPTLAAILGKGQKIKVPIGPIPTPEPYVGKAFPTYFRIAREPRDGTIKKCPINRTCRIELETDAANDYFSRSNDPGSLDVRGAARRVGAPHLWNGKAWLRFAPPAACTPGDRFQIIIDIADLSHAIPFQVKFAMEVEPEAVAEENDSPPTPPPSSSLAGLPNIVDIHRSEWVRHGFNELSVLELKYGDDSALDMYINLDNIHLKNEIARRRKTNSNTLTHQFKYGICLLALGMLHQFRQQTPDEQSMIEQPNEDELERFKVIARACQGLAVTLIPVITLLGHDGE